MAKQSRQKQIRRADRVARILLYLLAFAIMTFFPGLHTFKTLITKRQWDYIPLAYEIAKKGVEKRNEITQKQILAPYQPPPTEKKPLSQSPQQPNPTIYDLAWIWDPRSGEKPLVVNIPDSEVQRYFIVKLSAALSSPDVRGEIETPGTAARIEEMIARTVAAQKVEEIQLPEGKARFKEEIRTQMNEILGGNKIVAIYLTEFYFQ
jgi:hypothetical protein